jgi:hypothetical protein
MKTTREPLPPGDAGVARTLAVMGRVARWAAAFPEVRGVALILRDPEALYEFLRERVVFQKDPSGLERVRNPIKLLGEIGANGRASGDCDDLATLAASIVFAMRLRPAFIVMGRFTGGRFEHVYYGVMDGGRVVPFDPQQRTAPGRFTPGAARQEIVAA